MRKLLLSIATLIVVGCGVRRESLADYVNPFIGTAAHGHTYPGATTPFGMVQLSPDTGVEGWDWCSGYHSSDSSIMGFSHTHLSGTGGGDLGDILFMPSAENVVFEIGSKAEPENGFRSRFDHNSEKGSAGYYAVTLDDFDIDVELSATPRTGLHRYKFANGTNNPHVMIDLRHGIQDRVNSAYINRVDNKTIEGWRRSNGWANDHTVFFRAEFSQPIKELKVDSVGKNVVAAAIFNEGVDTVEVQVAISAVSLDGAKINLDAERTTFADGRKAARELWNKELGKVVVEGDNDEDKEIFYTALYRSMTAPVLGSDADGSYRASDRKVYKDSTITNYGLFSLWDTFRALHPLLAIVQPERNAQFVSSMVRYYVQSGRLPVWDLNMCENNCMIGYHSIPVIASAYLKGTMPSDFDANLALEAMVASANSDTYGGLPYYRAFGYLPFDKENNTVSKGLEYAYDDWCIAVMARALGRDDIYSDFIVRAQYYKNMYDTDGFMKGRDSKGRRTPNFDPTALSILGQGDFTEGNSWQYSFFVPQDVNGHIELLGGDAKYIERLNAMFTDTTGVSGHALDVTGLIGQYAHGNEPSHHVAYLYSYAGAPYLTQQRVAQIKSEMYHTQRDGLSGNEDCGQMSAWYVLSAIGFYEVTPASGIYVLGTPTFDQVTIGRLTIVAKNLSKKNFYIEKAEWDGKPYTKSYITDDMVRGGGTLTLYMSAKPNEKFGASAQDRPYQKIEDNVLTSEQMLSKLTLEPIIDTEQRVFDNSITLTPTHNNADATMVYTLNGSEPTQSSTKVASGSAIVIDKACEVRIAAFDNQNGRMSSIGKYRFYQGQVPQGSKISGTAPTQPHVVGGLDALIDSRTGGDNFNNVGWLGFKGEADNVLTIELPTPRDVKQIGFNAILDVGNWIMLPSKVSVSFSVAAGGEKIGTTEFQLPSGENMASGAHYFTTPIKVDCQVKFIYITLRCDNLPTWHPGVGNPSWIFVDEITLG